MINFLTETQTTLACAGQTEADILFIGSEESGHECSWPEFQTLANFDYDNGFGSHIVAEDLIIVCKNGCILRRREYDGSEWWEVLKPFVAPKTKLVIHTLKGPHNCLAEIRANYEIEH